MRTRKLLEFIWMCIARVFMRVVAVYVISKDGYGLFLQRADGDTSVFGPEQDLEPPNGHIDQLELPREAAVRELKEETGIEADPSQLIYLGTGWILGKFPRGGVARYVLYVDENVKDILVKLRSEEHRDSMWLKPKPKILAREDRLPIPYRKCMVKGRRKLGKRGLLR